MEFLNSLPPQLFSDFSQSFHLFIQGDAENAFSLFTQSESSLSSFQAEPSYPAWFSSWKSAILSKQLSLLPSLPDPPTSFLPVLKVPEKGSPDEVLNRIISLYNDDKLAEAFNLLTETRKTHHQLFNDHESVLELERDYQEILDVLKLVNDTEGWHTECTGEVSVKYKNVEGTKTYSLLTEAVLDVPMKNYITMVFEVDLYSNWVPFCKKSYVIHKISRSRRVLGLEFNVRFVPGRHTCLYGFGANLLSTHGCIVIHAKSCDEKPYFKGLNLPKFETTRAHVDVLSCVLRPLSETQVSIQLLTNFDPNMYYVPYKILNFFSRKLAKGIFKKASKIAVNFKGSVYEERINSDENRSFYLFLDESEREYLKNMKIN